MLAYQYALGKGLRKPTDIDNIRGIFYPNQILASFDQ